MSITPSYKWIRSHEYGERLARAWARVQAAAPPETTEFALVNLPKKGGPGGPKSHDSLFYTALEYQTFFRSFQKRVRLL